MEKKRYEVGSLVSVDPSSLREDPLNSGAFPESGLEGLTRDIRNNGFFGEITAWQDDDGSLVIESGHRRKKSAAEAGLKEVRVRISRKPSNEVERRLNLVKWNVHGRPQTPLGTCALACFLARTYEMENDMKAERGEKVSPVNARVAEKLNLSEAAVVKYRALAKLSPQLARLVDKGACPWTSMVKAAALTPYQQDLLYRKLAGEFAAKGPQTGAWVSNEIREFSHLRGESPPGWKSWGELGFVVPDGIPRGEENGRRGSPTKRNRKKDGAKALRAALSALRSALGSGSRIRESDAEEAAGLLGEIAETAAEAARRYAETGAFAKKEDLENQGEDR